MKRHRGTLKKKKKKNKKVRSRLARLLHDVQDPWEEPVITAARDGFWESWKARK